MNYYPIITIFLFNILSLANFSISAESSGKCGNGIYWALNDDGLLRIYGKGEMKNLSKSSTPWRPDLIHQLRIDEGITRIGNNCFNSLKKVQSVTLPLSLQYIGIGAFANCTKLTNIELPDGLVGIEERAFENCENLTTIKLPRSLVLLGERAFNGCKGLVSISLPTTLNSIGSDAFSKCSLITDIQSLPDLIVSSNCTHFGLSVQSVERYRTDQINKQLAIEKAKVAEERNNQFPSVISDVDIDIPFNKAVNKSKFAFIIANEKYDHLADVPYALNDGNIFAMYCNYVLGIPKGNIRSYSNATYGNIQSALYEIKRIDEAFDGEAEMIIYYVGHGVPDDATREAYLVPSDASQPRPSMCIPLSLLYETLGSLQSKSSVVFIDACFSGASRDHSMLNNGERAIGIKYKGIALTGNVAVISATAGDQTAQPYKEKGHGLFTYYLLKILKDTNGEASLGEIKSFVSNKVRQTSTGTEFKPQSPTINISPDIVDAWEDWKLK